MQIVAILPDFNYKFLSENDFSTLEEAIEAAKKVGFKTVFMCQGECLGEWSPISGFRKV